MLTELHIEDLGVISTLDLVLGPGLTALTGETGAGKTMLVEAIGLLVGGRSDATIVRPGAIEARVEGRFINSDEEFVLARVIPADGRSRAYINGRLATVATLAEVGSQLVDLHGQHAHQRLLSTAVQRAALDLFGAIDVTDLRNCRARIVEIDNALVALGGDARSRAREIDLLSFQVGELEAAGLDDPDEEAELDVEQALLADAVAHRDAALGALDTLTADGAALDLLGLASSALAHRAPFAGLEERLRSVVADLGDVASELRDLSESIEEDPQRLLQIRERRQLLRDLRRKYGDSLVDVVEFSKQASERLQELFGYEERVASLEATREAALGDYGRIAEAVGRQRRTAAPLLSEAVMGHLDQLAMPHAILAVELGDDPGDDVSFLLAANPGSPLLPLNKVASGGELARTMLALRLVLLDDPSVLVFDEVDAGIGGSAAIAVGQALAKLGQQHQVLVVTHLAQVAACASAQIVVSKAVQGEATFASAAAVSGEQRVDEIARMLSGLSDSKSGREHALELLQQRHLSR